MIRSILTKSLTGLAIFAASAASSHATMAIRLSADNGATWATVVDGDVSDQNTNNGVVQFNGAIGSWLVNVDTGSSKPFNGTSAAPRMELGGANLSTAPGRMIIQFSDTGFTSAQAARVFTNDAGGTTSGNIALRTYVDKGNVLFGSSASYSDAGALGVSPSATASQLLTQGPLGDGSKNFPFAGSVQNPSSETGGAPFSMTLEAVITHDGGGSLVTSFSHVVEAPEPPSAPCVVSLCGNVIADGNCNGSKDGADKGMANIPVTLYDSLGVALATASTDTNGAYCFANQPGGSFSIRVSLPDGVTAFQNVTNLVGSATNCGATYGNINFYLCPPVCSVTVCGKVIKDTDCDGRHDGTEQGMPNFPVVLYSQSGWCSKSVATNYTGTNGAYCFENLKPGTYTVKIVKPSGYKAFCDITSFTVCATTCGKTYTNSNFYLCPPPVCPPSHWSCNPNWCLDTVKVGNNTCSKQQAWTILKASPGCADKTVTLCQQLIAAKLNRCMSTDANCVDQAIRDCDEFLKLFPFGCNLSGSSSAWATISARYQELLNFNNGSSCQRACSTTHSSCSGYNNYGCDLWGNRVCGDWSNWDRNCRNTWGWQASGTSGTCRWW